jgi:hypothetical protein
MVGDRLAVARSEHPVIVAMHHQRWVTNLAQEFCSPLWALAGIIETLLVTRDLEMWAPWVVPPRQPCSGPSPPVVVDELEAGPGERSPLLDEPILELVRPRPRAPEEGGQSPRLVGVLEEHAAVVARGEQRQ